VVAFAASASCKPGAAAIVGTWKNQTNQILRVNADLTGSLTQEAACSPLLAVTVDRDPFDAYFIRFNIDQMIFIPTEEKQYFAGVDSFCSKSDSQPMCRFCEVSGAEMNCKKTEQNLTDFGRPVVHDCSWTHTSSSPRVPPSPIPCDHTDASGCSTETSTSADGAVTDGPRGDAHLDASGAADAMGLDAEAGVLDASGQDAEAGVPDAAHDAGAADAHDGGRG
jgi:hypothetical protein